ncbi:MAG: methyltransferase domain-containing protein [Candidatus Paracaedibacter sp.]
MKCRVCLGTSSQVISFGAMPIANAFLNQDQFENEYFFELATAFCTECKMFQLIEQPNPQMMFHENYAFFSSTSKSMAIHFEKMAMTYLEEFVPDPKDAFVIELGSNDGIMLRHFAKAGIKHLGIEPSSNVAQIARQNGVNTISEFFNQETASQVEKDYRKADIISAANVMCHIPDLASVGMGVDILLKEKGIFVFEDPYLGDVIQKTSYDQIYDEHVYIFSVQSISHAFAPYGLEVFHVEPQATHGGSMRYYLCRQGTYPVRDSVTKQLEFEQILELDKIGTFEKFAKNCAQSKKSFIELLKKLKAEGKRVVGYAATSKSTTVLNYCEIGPDLIEYICDTTPIKQGKFSPGMHIPIRSYEDFKKDKPDYTVLFAWNHAEEIFEKEKDFISHGGQWIVFVPEVKILSSQESFIRHAV